jgi:uncharacterized protein (DUF1330 family)
MIHETETPRLFVTTLIWLNPGGRAALSKFRSEAGPLFRKYDLRVERVLAGTGKGQIVGHNPYEVPDVLQVFSLPSLDAFAAYTADAEYVRLASERDSGIARMSALLGDELPPDPSAQSSSEVGQRLYGMAFLCFQPGGEASLEEFDRGAQTLFARHGMHIERSFRVRKTLTPVGEGFADFMPERTVVFFLDDPAALRAYVTDPEYAERAPVRDRGLRSYQFFLGAVPA